MEISTYERLRALDSDAVRAAVRDAAALQAPYEAGWRGRKWSSMRITNTDAIKAALPAAQLIGEYVALRGGKGRCPFHDDKTPSLGTRGPRWKCWGCGAGGDVIEFYMRIEGVSFYDAVRALSARIGIPVDGQPVRDRRPVDTLAVEAATWWAVWRDTYVSLIRARRPEERLHALMDNHMAASNADVLAAYRRVRTPWLAASMMRRYHAEGAAAGELEAALREMVA